MQIEIEYRPKRPYQEPIKMTSNCAEVLQFLMQNNDESYSVDTIAWKLDMNVMMTQGCLTHLCTQGLVSRKRTERCNYYQFIPQNEEIEFTGETWTLTSKVYKDALDALAKYKKH